MDRDGSCSAPMEMNDRPDLSLLRPLWSLYTSMLEKEGGEKTTASHIFATCSFCGGGGWRGSGGNGSPGSCRRGLLFLDTTNAGFFEEKVKANHGLGFTWYETSAVAIHAWVSFIVGSLVLHGRSIDLLVFVDRFWISSYFSSSCPPRSHRTLFSGGKPCTGQYRRRGWNISCYPSSCQTYLGTEPAMGLPPIQK